MSRRAQESTGPIQNLVMILIIVAAASFAMYNFICDLSVNYGTSLTNESAFLVYNDSFGSTRDLATDMQARLNTNTTGTLDIVNLLITGGFGILLDVLQSIPTTFNTIIIVGMQSIGLGEYVAFAWTAILMVILFAILAIIMKVRA